MWVLKFSIAEPPTAEGGDEGDPGEGIRDLRSIYQSKLINLWVVGGSIFVAIFTFRSLLLEESSSIVLTVNGGRRVRYLMQFCTLLMMTPTRWGSSRADDRSSFVYSRPIPTVILD